MRSRVTDRSVAHTREAALRVKTRIEQLQKFLAECPPAFWAMVARDLQQRIDNLTEIRDVAAAKMSEAELRANVSEEKAYRYIKDLPVRVKDTLDKKKREYAALMEAVNARAKRA